MASGSRTTWSAQVSSLLVSARLCLTTAPDCDTTAGRLVDLQSETDTGSVDVGVFKTS